MHTFLVSSPTVTDDQLVSLYMHADDHGMAHDAPEKPGELHRKIAVQRWLEHELSLLLEEAYAQYPEVIGASQS